MGRVVKDGKERRRIFQTEGMVRTKEKRANLDFTSWTWEPLQGF